MVAIRTLLELRSFMAGGLKPPSLPPGTSIVPVSGPGLALEWIIPPGRLSNTVILYFHGGGWILGWYAGHRAMLSRICLAARCRGLAVDYRLAPEHPHPAALQDCLAAYRWLCGQGIAADRIIMAGDSAGGNLVLATMMNLRDSGDALPAAAVCLSPMTDLACTGDSFARHDDPMLDAGFVAGMARHYVGTLDPRLPAISPHYGSFSSLPPLLVQVGGAEILLSDATRLADQASAAGVAVRLMVWPGMWHVWQMFAPWLPEAAQAIDSIGRFIIERSAENAHTAVAGHTPVIEHTLMTAHTAVAAHTSVAGHTPVIDHCPANDYAGSSQ
jgi:acetyl esterase/lipase